MLGISISWKCSCSHDGWTVKELAQHPSAAVRSLSAGPGKEDSSQQLLSGQAGMLKTSE